MILIQLVTASIMKAKSPNLNTKGVIKEAAIQTVENAIDQTAQGMKKGETVYNILISILVPIVLLGSLGLAIYQVTLQDYMRAASTFILFSLLMVVRDIRREKNA